MRMVAGYINDVNGWPVAAKSVVPQSLWNWREKQLCQRLCNGIFELVVQPSELALEALRAPKRCHMQGLSLQHVFDECVGAFECLPHHR